MTKVEGSAPPTREALDAKPVEPAGTRRGSDIPTYTENPFLRQLVEMRTRAKRVTVSSGKAILDAKTGEVEDVAEIVQVKQVDSEEFVKIYTAQLKVFFDLTPPALKLLRFVLAQVQRRVENDVIIMNAALVADHFAREAAAEAAKPAPQHDDQPGVSRATQFKSKSKVKDVPATLSRSSYYRAVGELLEKNFLAACAHSTDLYYINPTMFWNGDRVRFVKEYVKKREKAKVDPNQLTLFEQQRALGKA